ncbi:MAG: hypothetical protein EA351_14115 [Gemmatimonadales bacterium]|nr:MAG: hypothetical protein EA351_14115 [Gemmatimonadales bacterium]
MGSRVSRGPVWLMVSIVAMVAAGCADGGPGAEEPIVRDSAGVRIVDHRGELPDTPRWAAPMTGAVELPGDFHRVAGGVVLEGAVVVADAGSREVRRFTPDGTPGRVVGGEGEGPGEFMGLSLLARWPGDSILAFDISLRRITLFDADLTFGRTFELEVTDAAPFGNLHGVMEDGTMVASGFSQLPSGGPQTGAQRYPSPLHLYGPGGEVRKVGFTELWTESYFDVMGSGAFSVMPVPMAASIRPAFGPCRVVLGETHTGQIRSFDSDGALRAIVRGTGPAIRLTSEARRTAIDRALEATAVGIEPEERRRQLEALEFPANEPVFSLLAIDREGLVWMAPHSGTDWTVFGEDGSFVARIELPDRIRPLEIGADYILAVVPDEFDVERVYRIPLEGR